MTGEYGGRNVVVPVSGIVWPSALAKIVLRVQEMLAALTGRCRGWDVPQQPPTLFDDIGADRRGRNFTFDFKAEDFYCILCCLDAFSQR